MSSSTEDRDDEGLDLDIDDLLPGDEAQAAGATVAAAASVTAAAGASTAGAATDTVVAASATSAAPIAPAESAAPPAAEVAAAATTTTTEEEEDEALDDAAFDRFEERLRDIDEIPVVKETPEVRGAGGKNGGGGASLGRMQIAVMSALFEHYSLYGSAASALSLSDAGLTKNQFVRFARDARLCSATGTASGVGDASLPAGMSVWCLYSSLSSRARSTAILVCPPQDHSSLTPRLSSSTLRRSSARLSRTLARTNR